MIFATLHGLLFSKPAISVLDSYGSLTINAHNAPMGKSHGSYTLDSTSAMTLVKTQNLPNMAGTALKQVQIDFLLERLDAPSGDFIIATAKPFFPANLGAPIISEHYVNGFMGRKFFMSKEDGVWTAWKELNCATRYIADFEAQDNASLTVEVDPQTVVEYFIKMGLNSIIMPVLAAPERFSRPVFLDFSPVSSNYTIIWPTGLVWKNAAGTPPSLVEVGSRFRVEISKTFDGVLLAHFEVYKVT